MIWFQVSKAIKLTLNYQINLSGSYCFSPHFSLKVNDCNNEHYININYNAKLYNPVQYGLKETHLWFGVDEVLFKPYWWNWRAVRRTDAPWCCRVTNLLSYTTVDILRQFTGHEVHRSSTNHIPPEGSIVLEAVARAVLQERERKVVNGSSFEIYSVSLNSSYVQ